MMAWLKKSEIFLKLLCVLFAFLLWLYVVNSENQDIKKTYQNVNVVFQNQEEIMEKYGVIVISGQETPVSVDLSGKRTDMATISSEKDVTAVVDLSVISSEGTHKILYNISLPTPELTVQKKTPSYITVVADKLVYKEIPISVNVSGKLADGYSLGNIITDVENITISGAENQVERAMNAVASVNVDGLSQNANFKLDYKIVDQNGNEIQDDYILRPDIKINAQLPITKNVKRQCVVNLISAPGIDSKYATVSIEPEYITVTAVDDILNDLKFIDLGDIQLENIGDDTTIEMAVKMPQGVTNVYNIDTVKVKIQLNGIITKEIKTTNIKLVQKDNRYIFEPIASGVKVKIKGHESIVNTITPDMITVNAKFSADNYKDDKLVLGWYMLPAEISIKGNPDIAVIGETTAIIKVSEKK